MKTTITIEVDSDRLSHVEDSYLAALWHAAQANGAPSNDVDAADLADSIGVEIIRRWLGAAPAMLYERRISTHYLHILQQHGCWTGPGRTWQPTSAGNEPKAAEAVRSGGVR
ncbi:MAG: hypothetical protein Q8N44_18515 [Rubrivivax sp.]|nr:hypothetical protein [Rubrivivax sp.]MDP3085665.1 hypothetical protein [Rubrivivax sp.]